MTPLQQLKRKDLLRAKRALDEVELKFVANLQTDLPMAPHDANWLDELNKHYVLGQKKRVFKKEKSK